MRMRRLNATVSCEEVGWVCAACCAVIRSPQAATIPCRISERLMPNIRLMLWGVLAAILFLNYQTWLHDYEPPVSAVAQPGTAPAGAPASTLGDSVPQPTVTAPTAAQTANAPAAAPASSAPSSAAA